MISVIVPVYNAKNYLERCVNSILGQTFTDFELFLVDDGSTDGSDKICDRLEKKDCRIKVIHKQNGGASSARNAGIDAATGEYITFVDADDYISPYYLGTLYRVGKCDNSDMACYIFGEPESCEENYELINKVVDERIVVSSEEMLKQFREKYHWLIWGVPFNKLYKRAAFGSIRFIEGMIYEDEEVLPRLIRQTNRISIIPAVLYYYTQSENSVMRSPFSKKRFDVMEMEKRLALFFWQEGFVGQAVGYVQDYMVSLLHFDQLTKSPEYKQYRRYYKQYIYDFKNNRKIYLKILRDAGRNTFLRITIICFMHFRFVSHMINKRLYV